MHELVTWRFKPAWLANFFTDKANIHTTEQLKLPDMSSAGLVQYIYIHCSSGAKQHILILHLAHAPVRLFCKWSGWMNELRQSLVGRVSLNSCNAIFLATSRSLFWYHAVIASAPLPVKSGFKTWERIVLPLVHFVTITWQQIFKGSLQITECCHFNWFAAKSSRFFLLSAVNFSI